MGMPLKYSSRICLKNPYFSRMARRSWTRLNLRQISMTWSTSEEGSWKRAMTLMRHVSRSMSLFPVECLQQSMIHCARLSSSNGLSKYTSIRLSTRVTFIMSPMQFSLVQKCSISSFSMQLHSRSTLRISSSYPIWYSRMCRARLVLFMHSLKYPRQYFWITSEQHSSMNVLHFSNFSSFLSSSYLITSFDDCTEIESKIVRLCSSSISFDIRLIVAPMFSALYTPSTFNRNSITGYSEFSQIALIRSQISFSNPFTTFSFKGFT